MHEHIYSLEIQENNGRFVVCNGLNQGLDSRVCDDEMNIFPKNEFFLKDLKH
jgi:hypothetical protein